MDEESAMAFALRATAYHEAGHAVMAMILGRAVQKVTIVPGQSHLGAQRLGACHLQKDDVVGDVSASDEKGDARAAEDDFGGSALSSGLAARAP